MTAKEYLQNTASKLTASEVEGVSTTLHFDFGEGADYSIIIADGKTTFNEGFVGSPECVIKAKADDFVKVVSGDINPMMAMMMGKLKISNPGAMMKYAKILGLM